jgi:hypothetical protein
VFIMAQGRQLNEWNYFASLMAVIVNVNRDPRKGKPAKGTDFHPMLAKPKQKADMSDFVRASREMARRRRLKLAS